MTRGDLQEGHSGSRKGQIREGETRTGRSKRRGGLGGGGLHPQRQDTSSVQGRGAMWVQPGGLQGGTALTWVAAPRMVEEVQ